MCRVPKMIRPGEVLGANLVLNLWFLQHNLIEAYAEALYLAIFEDTETIIKVRDNDDDEDTD